MGAQKEDLDAAHQLFSVSFPEFAIHDPDTLIRLISDKRIGSLRTLVNSAATGDVQFDEGFARKTLLAPFENERESLHFRDMAFFLTLPLHFIPFVGAAIHKAVEEVAAIVYARHVRKPYEWFCLLSDVSRKSGEGKHQNR